MDDTIEMGGGSCLQRCRRTYITRHAHLAHSISLDLEQRILGSGTIWEHFRNVRARSGSGQF